MAVRYNLIWHHYRTRCQKDQAFDRLEASTIGRKVAENIAQDGLDE